ncbi:aspartate-semialdehyde dehydrogenase {non-peptidoglycan organisms} [Geoglobus ahangari]|uniref:Aspartate-semialdehyde dehydrogenase n=1 Tax=Geoglobus ahangari TaxID=113653 RepID=A0A0F7ICY7_9EURY|nr:aspartate-semialdehyde dehydrogenase [Geoglobus ahangari]AKG91139.1 aspartate-semialdehyde dehydrogenase {non-peptidoglycan organisms} [Geoglobus ahangari]
MRYKVAILGATGMVGQKFIQLLDNHPWFDVSAVIASERRVGKIYGEEVDWIVSRDVPKSVRDLEMLPMDPKKVDADIVFSALPSDVAREVEAKFAAEGFVVASNASAFRMEPDVPLVIPEVNPDHLGLIEVQKRNRGWDGFIVTNPNCTTIVLVITLKPLMELGLKEVNVATMQALSGAGYPGVPSLAITDNILPFIKGEEDKVESEPLKLLGRFEGSEIRFASLRVSASCHRVPVIDGHTEAVFARFDRDVSVDDVIEAFKSLKPIEGLPTSPEEVIVVREEQDRPQPRLDRDAGNGMSVVVGRVRKDGENGVKYIAMGHNTVRGAAGASILNAELMAKEKLI